MTNKSNTLILKMFRDPLELKSALPSKCPRSSSSLYTNTNAAVISPIFLSFSSPRAPCALTRTLSTRSEREETVFPCHNCKTGGAGAGLTGCPASTPRWGSRAGSPPPPSPSASSSRCGSASSSPAPPPGGSRRSRRSSSRGRNPPPPSSRLRRPPLRPRPRRLKPPVSSGSGLRLHAS